MSKKILITLLCTVMVFTTACQNGNSPANTSDTGVTDENETAAASTENNEPVADSAPDSSESEAISRPDPEECLKAYGELLNGDGEIWFDYFAKDGKISAPEWDYENISDHIAPGVPFSLGEVAEGLTLGVGEFFDIPSPVTKNISYAYIDCGKDDVPELAVLFEGIGNDYNSSSCVAVFKLIDGKVQCIFQKVYGYRSDIELNEYGYYYCYGANGADSSSAEYYYIAPDGQYRFLYSLDQHLSAYSLYLPDNNEYMDVAEKEGIASNIEIDMYSFQKYNSDMEYTDYIKSCDFVYYPISNNSNKLTGDKLNDAVKSGSYERFWKSTGLANVSEDEINEKIGEVLNKAGVSATIQLGKSANWLELSESQLDTLLSWESAYTSVPVTLINPSWEYYTAFKPEPVTSLTLKETSKKANNIIDTDNWFSSLGLVQPERLSFDDGTYQYKLYGTDSEGLEWYPFMMDINDLSSGQIISTLNFTSFYFPDEIAIGDKSFVEESIHWAVADDGILYVSTYHMTYASSASHNGYITAFDMNDNYNVLWRSEPLTCNSSNFIVTDDAIICGYGFTDEPDYVYVLDKGCGSRTQTVKVKTSPEWFELKDNKLYVRCYDTDYEFDVTQ